MTADRQIVVLSGGLGGARLAMAAVENGWSDRAAFITNVADDWEVGSMLICPDTDAVIYGLTGRFDHERGWGVAGDVFPGSRPGEPPWFGIGNIDRRHHERRTRLVAEGAPLSKATRAMTRSCKALVTPVTDDQVRSMIRVGHRWRIFQEWLIHDHAAQPDEIRWDGIEAASPALGVIDLIERADTVVIASSSPIASIGPILAVSGLTDALLRTSGRVIALSPISSRPMTSQRDERRALARSRLMRVRGLEHAPLAVLDWLAPLVTHFAVDEHDAHLVPQIEERGVTPMVFPVLGLDASQRESIGNELFAQRVRHR